MASVRESREEFLTDCDYVVRAPGSFFFSGEHSVEVGQPALLIATDFWMYAGVKRRRAATFSITLTEPNPSAPLDDEDMLDPALHYIAPTKLDKHLKGSLSELRAGLREWQQQTTGVSSFDLQVWSDFPFAVGLNAGAALSACLGMILYFEEKKAANDDPLNIKELNRQVLEFANQDYQLLQQNEAFQRIFCLGRWCDNLLSGRLQCGAAVYTSLARTVANRHGANPGQIMFLFAETPDDVTVQPVEREKIDFVEQTAKIATQKVYATRIAMPDWLETAYGMTLLYSGARADSTPVHGELKHWHRMHVDLVSRLLWERLGEIPAEDIAKLQPPIRYILEGAEGMTEKEKSLSRLPHEVYLSALGMISLRILEVLDPEVTTGGPSDLNKLIIDNNKMLKAYGILRPPLRTFKSQLRKEILPESLREKCWLKITGPGNGGDLIIFAKSNILRQINKFLQGRFFLELKENEARWHEDFKNEQLPQIHCTSVTNNKFIPENCAAAFYTRNTRKKET
ncbi:MAG: hypothetical protein ABIJ61_02800, partial [bacterium]